MTYENVDAGELEKRIAKVDLAKIKSRIVDALNLYYGNDTAQAERLALASGKDVEAEYRQVFNVTSTVTYF